MFVTDKTKAKLPTIEKSYKLTPYDLRATETYLARKKRKPLAPRVSVKDGAATLAVECTDPATALEALGAIALEALGSRDFDFLHGLSSHRSAVRVCQRYAARNRHERLGDLRSRFVGVGG
jgi:hypothetical protein